MNQNEMIRIGDLLASSGFRSGKSPECRKTIPYLKKIQAGQIGLKNTGWGLVYFTVDPRKLQARATPGRVWFQITQSATHANSAIIGLSQNDPKGVEPIIIPRVAWQKLPDAFFGQIQEMLAHPVFREVMCQARNGLMISMRSHGVLVYSTFPGDRINLVKAPLEDFAANLITNHIASPYYVPDTIRRKLYQSTFRRSSISEFRTMASSVRPTFPRTNLCAVPSLVTAIVRQQPAFMDGVDKAEFIAGKELWYRSLQQRYSQFGLTIDWHTQMVPVVQLSEMLLQILLLQSAKAPIRANALNILPSTFPAPERKDKQYEINRTRPAGSFETMV